MKNNPRQYILSIPILLAAVLVLTACTTDVDLSQSPTDHINETEEIVTSAPAETAETNIVLTERPYFELIFDADIPDWVQSSILDHPTIQEQRGNLTESINISFETTPYLIGEIQYFLVTPFETPISSITRNEFDALWRTGKLHDDTLLNGTLQISEETEKIFIHKWGTPANMVSVIPLEEDKFIESLFDTETSTLAVIPAQYLNPSLRTINIDNISFFDTLITHSLTYFSVPIYSSTPLVDKPIAINYAKDHLTTVNITGVTALVRATAVLMRVNGNQYPAEKIEDILLNADYTHISNEVSFSPSCPPQDYTSDDLRFCSPPSTFELLEYIDADIIELTGDHLEDFGVDPFLFSLETYQEANMAIYGGGENLENAQKPLKIELNGNKFAFLGCNAKSPSYAHASESYPGTWFCDLEILKEIITDLHNDDYTPIVTIQHLENELNTPPNQLVTDFDELAQNTPIILIGSQAHVPKPYKIEEDVFIHYGLGNLFFDQINESEDHARALIDRLVFYDNQLLTVEIYPIQFVNYAQTRLMTAEESQTFLTKILKLSNFTQP